jgi:hypothetical protein
MTKKRGTGAFIIGGTLWAVVMVAYLKTHGAGADDYQRLLFGFSRDNYLLLLSPAALLLGYGLALLRRRFLPLTGRLFAVASMGALILLGVFALGNLLVATQAGVGEQPPWPNDSLANLIGAVGMFLAPSLLGICLALMGIMLWRVRQFLAGAGALLAPLALITLIALVPWQVINGYSGVVFGLAWIALGLLYAAELRAPMAIDNATSYR